MNDGRITCPDLATFVDLILELTARGLTFTADAGTFEVHLTGGY